MTFIAGPLGAALDFDFFEFGLALLDLGLVGFGFVGFEFFLLTDLPSYPHS